MHACTVEPAEERLAGGLLSFHEVDGCGRGLVVDGFHPLLGQRPGIFDGLLADLAEAWIDRGIVAISRLAFQDAARTELGKVAWVLWIVRQFRLFLGIEVVEIAEELIEAIHRGQRRVSITDMVLAELPGGVAKVLEQAANRGIKLAHAHRRAGKTHLGQAAADAMLASQERGSTGGARLLAIIVKKLDALTSDAIDARGLIAHQAVRIGADVRDADIVTPDDQDVRLAAGRCSRRRSRSRRGGCWRSFLGLCKSAGSQCCRRNQGGSSKQDVTTIDSAVFALVR